MGDYPLRSNVVSFLLQLLALFGGAILMGFVSFLGYEAFKYLKTRVVKFFK